MITINRLLLAAALGMVTLPVWAQKKPATAAHTAKKPVPTKLAVTPAGYKFVNGVLYKFIVDVPGTYAKPGDMLEMNMIVKAGRLNGSKDTTIANSLKDMGKPIQMPFPESRERGDMSAVLGLMSAGDSAVMALSVDTVMAMMKGQPVPPYLKRGEYIMYTIKMLSVKDAATAEQEKKDKAAQQVKIDDQLMRDYFAKNNLKPVKTNSGMYYLVTKEGTGAGIKKGQSVSMNYTGTFLDGKAFDSNIDTAFHHAGQAFTVTAGTGSVIPGFDEGMQLLKKGGKGKFYIPSGLAYGEQGGGQVIPPNSVIVFDVEVTDVQDAEAPTEGK